MLPGTVVAAFHYQFADPMVRGAMIEEMRPFYFDASGRLAGALVILFLILGSINRRKMRAGEIIWLLVSFVLMMSLGRFVAVFAIVASPMFAAVSPSISDRLLGRPMVCGIMAIILAVGLTRTVGAFPRQDTSLDAWLNRNDSEEGFPCNAADFVAAQVVPTTGHLINEFDWGGYLEWRLFLATVSADAAILPIHHSAFHKPLVELGWKIAFRDSRSEVLVPPSSTQPTPLPVFRH
jgi:hypothetical protein